MGILGKRGSKGSAYATETSLASLHGGNGVVAATFAREYTDEYISRIRRLGGTLRPSDNLSWHTSSQPPGSWATMGWLI